MSAGRAIEGRCGTYATYDDYLQSEEWAIRRRFAIRHADERCQLCYASGHLHAHHRTYVRIGQEKPTDMTVLCDECHAWFHVPKSERVRFETEALQDMAAGGKLDAERFAAFVGRTLRIDGAR
jgi:hypothetical protein